MCYVYRKTGPFEIALFCPGRTDDGGTSSWRGKDMAIGSLVIALLSCFSPGKLPVVTGFVEQNAALNRFIKRNI